MRILLPLIIVSGIALFVVNRLKVKYDKGTLGKKKTKYAQDVLDSLLPIGMVFGCAIGVILSMVFSMHLLSTLSLGAGIGLLLGYFGYEIYS